MNKLFKGLILALFIGVFAYQTAPALAYNPVLNISGGLITITGGQPNASVVLNYIPAGSSLETTITGTTDYSGYFNVQVGSIGGQVTATVGGLQVYQNGFIGGCTYNCGSPYGLSLSQSSVSVNTGQSVLVNAYVNNNFGNINNIYISSNSNSSVATASVSGNQITIFGRASGSTNISVCQNNNYSACATIYVTVSGNGCNYIGCSNGLSLSQTSLSLTAGQSNNITIYNNSGYLYGSGYYVYSNSNSNVASASVSGNNLLVSAGYTSGSTTIKVCQTNNNSICADLYVTVSGNNFNNLSLSQSTLTMSTGQTSVVTAYNFGSNLYVSNNTNSSVASVSISGANISIYANTSGSTNITVCSGSLSQCGTIYVTVNGNGGSLSFSQNNVYLTSGQSSNITVYGGGTYYISSNSNPNVVSTSLSGSTIYLNALSSGTSNLNVCQYGGYQCSILYVTVNGGSYGTISLSQTSVNLTQNQSTTVYIYGGGSYYISSNSNSSVASASLSGNQINIFAGSFGSSNISICQNNSNVACVTLFVNVSNNGSGNLSFGSQTLPALVIGQYYSYQIPVLGGTAPYSFALTGGGLPNGLTLSQSGLVYGTPVSSNVSSFSVRVTDNFGRVGNTTFGFGSTGGGVLGANTYNNGTLISENGTVYITYKNLKTPFANAAAFRGLGFDFNNVISVGANSLINSGYTVSSAYVQHPWGSWIKSGNTVYFVHQSGLIPVPNWDTFLNNGGPANGVVNANTWDFRLPMLSAMVYNDSRLQ